MQKRITIFDTVRGFTMLSMAGFHACYDLAYLYGREMPWFTETVFQDIWRASISWVFLFIAGWMCTLSRNNGKRAQIRSRSLDRMDCNYTGVSRRFGKLWHHLLHGSVHRGGCTHPSVTHKNTGLVGHRSVPYSFCPNLGHSKGGLPTPLPGMAWIPGPGLCFGRLLSAHSVCLYVPYRLFAAQETRASSLEASAWAYANPIPALAVLGRHALPFYLLHQPVILGVLELVYSVR